MEPCVIKKTLLQNTPHIPHPRLPTNKILRTSNPIQISQYTDNSQMLSATRISTNQLASTIVPPMAETIDQVAETLVQVAETNVDVAKT